jgi:glucose-induced degradation protein 4
MDRPLSNEAHRRVVMEEFLSNLMAANERAAARYNANIEPDDPSPPQRRLGIEAGRQMAPHRYPPAPSGTVVNLNAPEDTWRSSEADAAFPQHLLPAALINHEGSQDEDYEVNGDEEDEEDDYEEEGQDDDDDELHQRARRRRRRSSPSFERPFTNMTRGDFDIIDSRVDSLFRSYALALDQRLQPNARNPVDTSKVYSSLPPPCSFLHPGTSYRGEQLFTAAIHKSDSWRVAVNINSYIPLTGELAGTMYANNVSQIHAKDLPVRTFFEGEIIDIVNHSFYTSEFSASALTDLRHWSKFPSFKDLKAEAVVQGGRVQHLDSHPFIYMRWKEKFFIGNDGCKADSAGRLTIAGFYYVCLNRVTGDMDAYYWDPTGPPEQRLTLKVEPSNDKGGFGFGCVEVC